MDKEYVNLLINQEIVYSDKLSQTYNYPDNITHLLYLIIPAFILKYGNNHKNIIEKCFMDVPIVINDKQDKIYQAYYYSKPKYIDNNIASNKGIVLNNYKDISLIQLLDNLVHEYNHAVNSIQNEIVVDDVIKIRTGVSYNYFNKNDLSFKNKGDEIILEEVINTKQTETIIDIIKSFSSMEIENTIVSNTLYSIYHTVGDNYKSKSYYLESIVCKKLMDNKTFISTFEKLRFDGQVDDLYNFFDTVTGKEGSFLELSKLLSKILDLNRELNKTKWFRNIKINKIKEKTSQALEIVELFNRNTVYK